MCQNEFAHGIALLAVCSSYQLNTVKVAEYILLIKHGDRIVRLNIKKVCLDESVVSGGRVFRCELAIADFD